MTTLIKINKTKTIMKNLINYLKEPVIRMNIIGAILWIVGLFTIVFALPTDVDIMTKIYLIAGFIIAIIGWLLVKKAERIITVIAYMSYKMLEAKIKSGETVTDDELSLYNSIKEDKTMKYIDAIVKYNGKKEI